jgi:hypothetical protein
MRTTHCLIAALGSMLVAALTSGLGCGSLPADCPDRYRCPDTTGSGGSNDGGGGTGGGGGPPVSCIPSENDGAVATTCGVFVSTSLGADQPGQGTREKPWKTLAAGIKAAMATKKPLYVCAESFSEALTLSAAVTVYGGLDCKQGWAYVGATKKSTLTADPDKTPLTLAPSAGGVMLHDLAIHAADGQSQDAGGGSSIAVIADQATASFVRCEIVAGNGMSGPAGDTPKDDVGPSDPMDFAIVGNAGTKACTAGSTTPGGAAKVNTFCSDPSPPIGGGGGVGSIGTGGDGEATPANAQTATGGKGQPSADPSWGCQVGQGALGLPGTPGTPGEGAKGNLSLGTLSTAGYAGVDGQPGGPGGPGQGGGGGGGAKGKAAAPTCYGASGGGGGVGGCGAPGGTGGRFGGASIGIIDLDATLTFDTVTIKVSQGGKGGDGEFGGVGGNGGNGGLGNGTSPACNGGNGGNGGQGGKGGGARGGHAIGIAYTMAKPDVKSVTFTPGMPGTGGMGEDPAHSGEDGIGANLQAF